MKMVVTKKGLQIANIKLTFSKNENDKFAYDVVKEYAESKSMFSGWQVDCKIGKNEIEINMDGVDENKQAKIFHTLMMLKNEYEEIQK